MTYGTNIKQYNLFPPTNTTPYDQNYTVPEDITQSSELRCRDFEQALTCTCKWLLNASLPGKN